MASNHLFILAIFFVLTVLPSISMATQHIVGDNKGWTINFDYQAWAKDKKFVVGDQLVFKYPVGVHNVFKVNGTGFQNCVVPPTNEALVTGNDKIVLATPGRKWYICGVGKHCVLGGQKLAITVTTPAPAPSSSSPSPSPSPWSAATVATTPVPSPSSSSSHWPAASTAGRLFKRLLINFH
ncbi:blue copper protein-like [Quillaja saponaria]|uniref:Blue copper protein-like n=1 Tax=Quillaja saponaria TaxID=32244 RepID=A0AAD7PZA9_QUISA|nr:blue copper protein-like [Quillaja saponaria]